MNGHFLYRHQGNSKILGPYIKRYFGLKEFSGEVDEIDLTALWGNYETIDFLGIWN